MDNFEVEELDKFERTKIEDNKEHIPATAIYKKDKGIDSDTLDAMMSILRWDTHAGMRPSHSPFTKVKDIPDLISNSEAYFKMIDSGGNSVK